MQQVWQGQAVEAADGNEYRTGQKVVINAGLTPMGLNFVVGTTGMLQ